MSLFWGTAHSREYLEYLRSPEWQVVRRRALRGARNRCERCGKSKREAGWLEINHKHYRTAFGSEQWPRDLEALCHPCHKRADAARRKVTRPRRTVLIGRIVALFMIAASGVSMLVIAHATFLR